jgi:predicted MPP superfamily phosphohydrolase
MTLFFLVALAVFGGFLVWVWHRLAIAPRWGRRWVPWTVAVVMLVLTAFVFEGFDVWGTQFSPAAMRPVAWTGQTFLASCLYLFLGLVPVWLVSVLLWFVLWRRDHGRAARRTLNRVASPLVVLVTLGLMAYGTWEATQLTVTRYEVSSPDLPEEFDGTTVALVADIHAGAVRSASFTRGVVDLVNAQQPDLVVIAGDLEDGTAARYGPELAPLTDLGAPLGVFAVTGNHEMYRDTANWIEEFRSLGLTVLENDSAVLTRDGATITLAGVHDREGSGEWAPDPEAALAATRPSDFLLFLAHQPVEAEQVQGRGVDLQMSGHTHCGQMWPLNYLVPLQQPVVRGLQDVGDVPVLTTCGVGAWGPAVRVFAPPELPVVTLRRG